MTEDNSLKSGISLEAKLKSALTHSRSYQMHTENSDKTEQPSHLDKCVLNFLSTVLDASFENMRSNPDKKSDKISDDNYWFIYQLYTPAELFGSSWIHFSNLRYKQQIDAQSGNTYPDLILECDITRSSKIPTDAILKKIEKTELDKFSSSFVSEDGFINLFNEDGKINSGLMYDLYWRFPELLSYVMKFEDMMPQLDDIKDCSKTLHGYLIKNMHLLIPLLDNSKIKNDLSLVFDEANNIDCT